MRTAAAITGVSLLGVVHGFSSSPAFSRQSTELQMGLFDGVKDAFSAPALERSTLDAERETPIDRWMGWSVARDASGEQQKQDIGMRTKHPVALGGGSVGIDLT
jgi:hypothetical protein